jgi:hypothetical protein
VGSVVAVADIVAIVTRRVHEVRGAAYTAAYTKP